MLSLIYYFESFGTQKLYTMSILEERSYPCHGPAAHPIFFRKCRIKVKIATKIEWNEYE